MAFTAVFHHKSYFVKEPNLHYKEREVHRFNNLDAETWSFFEAIGLVKDLGYTGNFKLWWKHKNVTFEERLKELVVDKDALELSNYAISV